MTLKGKILDPLNDDYMPGTMLNSTDTILGLVPALWEFIAYLRKYKHNMSNAIKEISMK